MPRTHGPSRVVPCSFLEPFVDWLGHIERDWATSLKGITLKGARLVWVGCGPVLLHTHTHTHTYTYPLTHAHTHTHTPTHTYTHPLTHANTPNSLSLSHTLTLTLTLTLTCKSLSRNSYIGFPVFLTRYRFAV